MNFFFLAEHIKPSTWMVWFFWQIERMANKLVKKGKNFIYFTLLPLILCCWLAHQCHLYMLKMYDFCCLRWEGSSANLYEGDNIESSTTGYQRPIHCRCIFLAKQGLGAGGLKGQNIISSVENWFNPGLQIFTLISAPPCTESGLIGNQ